MSPVGDFFPRCAACRVTVEPGLNVVFRADGRVYHAACPKVFCPICSREIVPAQPIRRDGDTMMHANCWIKRFRAQRADSVVSLIRTKLADRTLPSVTPTAVWGGEGNGEVCAACDKAIQRTQWEVELDRKSVV